MGYPAAQPLSNFYEHFYMWLKEINILYCRGAMDYARQDIFSFGDLLVELNSLTTHKTKVILIYVLVDPALKDLDASWTFSMSISGVTPSACRLNSNANTIAISITLKWKLFNYNKLIQIQIFVDRNISVFLIHNDKKILQNSNLGFSSSSTKIISTIWEAQLQWIL